MLDNNKIDQFVRDYEEAKDKYLAAAGKVQLSIDILERKLKKHNGPEINRRHYRIKDVIEVIKKAESKGIVSLDLDEVEQNVHDIVGYRVVTTFKHGVYEIAEELKKFPGLNVIKIKDYYKNPKKSGYRSLHLIVLVEVYNGESSQVVQVEIQIVDVLQDAWNSIEHEMKYKNDSLSESLDSSFVKHAASLHTFADEIDEYALHEKRRAEINGNMSNTARVASVEPLIEPKTEC